MLTGLRSCGVAFPDTVTTPIGTFDPFYSYVYGLYHFDGGYGDSGPGGRSLIATSTTTTYGVTDTTPRYGTGSMRCTRGATTTGLVKLPPNAALNVTGDFTIEFWMRSTGTQGTYSNLYQTLGSANLSATAAPANSFAVANWTNAAGTGTGGTTLTSWLGTGGTQLRLTSTSNPNDGAWHHIAISRSGTTARLFFDGNLQASGTYSVNLDFGQTYGLAVGRYSNTDASNIYNGWIDDLRMTIGVARYTASFSVPSAAFPNSG